MSRARELAEIATAYDSGSPFGFCNRIINGQMMIDQRNAGAEVNPAVSITYYTDRWFTVAVAGKYKIGKNAGGLTGTNLPAGFTTYLGATSLSAYSVGASETNSINQSIEGLNVADLGWGTANAAPVTVSFWVRSSLTGTFGGTIRNSTPDRTYVFSYTISAANTWEYKTVTIAGDTSGTWLTTNGVGLRLGFSIGSGTTVSNTAGSWYAGSYTGVTGGTSVVGTSGATFYITGVQLEKGSTATSFDYRPYGTELALCQRYYYRVWPKAATQALSDSGGCYTTTQGFGTTHFPVTMRTVPTALEQSGTAGDYSMAIFGVANPAMNAVPAISVLTTTDVAYTTGTVASGLTANSTGYIRAVNANAYLGWSAEL